MRGLFFSLIVFSMVSNAQTYTRCKMTHPLLEPDVYCLEEKGFHSKKYCSRLSSKIFGTPRASKVKREIVYGVNILSSEDPYWTGCSSVYIDGRCWMLFGVPCF